MPVVRSAQVEAFHPRILDQFEGLLAGHAREFAPKHTEVLGEQGTLAVVKTAIARGAAYGFDAQAPLELFLDLMFLLGSEFDTDLQYPWAAEILSPKSPGNQMEKADRLHAASIGYLDAVAGPDNEYAQAALQALRDQGGALVRETKTDFRTAAPMLMRKLYPQKVDHLGPAITAAVVERAIAECAARQIQTLPGYWVITAFDFALGHAITRDPLYPWVKETLNDERIAQPDERAGKLYSKAKVYIDHAIQHWKET
ncbi:MAG: hypothetical protein U0Q16_24490 [Bryobacteraceae bacterium]